MNRRIENQKYRVQITFKPTTWLEDEIERLQRNLYLSGLKEITVQDYKEENIIVGMKIKVSLKDLYNSELGNLPYFLELQQFLYFLADLIKWEKHSWTIYEEANNYKNEILFFKNFILIPEREQIERNK